MHLQSRSYLSCVLLPTAFLFLHPASTNCVAQPPDILPAYFSRLGGFWRPKEATLLKLLESAKPLDNNKGQNPSRPTVPKVSVHLVAVPCFHCMALSNST